MEQLTDRDLKTLVNTKLDDLWIPTGHGNAIVGVAMRESCVVAVLDANIIIDNLREEGMDEFEAYEWYEYNIRGSHIGDETPYFVNV